MLDDHDYPPINRKPNIEIGPADACVISAVGPVKLSANEVVAAVFHDRLERILNLNSPTQKMSVISMVKRGFIYQTNEIELILDKDELLRLLRHDLTPQEYFTLREEFGIFFEIHDDFYDRETGEALSPY